MNTYFVFLTLIFLFTFLNVRLPLCSLHVFLAECGVVTFHTSGPSYKAEGDTHMYIHFLCAQLLLEINNSLFSL